MKLKDGSEQVRIKLQFAERIRQAADEKGISFLDMVYVIFTDYFFLRDKEKVTVPIQEITQHKKVKTEQKIDTHSDENSDDDCTLDIDI